MGANGKHSNALLKEAVHQSPILGKTGLAERLFTSWFGDFFYNQIWEDPRVDVEALKLGPNSRMLTISSGGCNVLNYLAYPVAQVNAVDLNPCHICLLRLKLVALEHLPDYESFFSFFGEANSEQNLDNYRRYIRDHLDPATREFWEGGGWFRQLVVGPRIKIFEKNLYDYARLGYFFRFIHGLSKVAGCDAGAVLRAKTREEQEAAFDSHVAPLFDHWIPQMVGKVPFLVFGLGIPPRQYDAMKKELNGSLVNLYRSRLRRLAVDFPVEDNYFCWQAFKRGYDTDTRRAVPDYLKEQNYARIKGALPKVTTENTTLHAFLSKQEPGALNGFVFLDSQDWMKPEQIADLWAKIDRAGEVGSRIIFRTASSQSPIEAALPPELMARFRYHDEESRAFHARDRSAIYGGFHLYEKVA